MGRSGAASQTSRAPRWRGQRCRLPMPFDLVARLARAVAVSLALSPHSRSRRTTSIRSSRPRAPPRRAPVEVLARRGQDADRRGSRCECHDRASVAGPRRRHAREAAGPGAERAGDRRVQGDRASKRQHAVRERRSRSWPLRCRKPRRARDGPASKASFASHTSTISKPARAGSSSRCKVASDESRRSRSTLVPDALQRGMRVEVRGALLHGRRDRAGAIVINGAARRTRRLAKAGLKATKTDNVLVILMRFTDSPAQPFTQAQVQAVVAGGPGSDSVAEYYKEASFGQQLINATVTPWLATGASTPANCDWRAMGTLGRNAATAAGLHTGQLSQAGLCLPARVRHAAGWASAMSARAARGSTGANTRPGARPRARAQLRPRRTREPRLRHAIRSAEAAR